MPFLTSRGLSTPSSSDRQATFVLAPPPRTVPASLRLRLLVGGFLGSFGWVFLGFGGIFVWVFAAQADSTSWYRFNGALETRRGRVTACEPTGASVGGSKNRRGTPVFANAFSVDGGGPEGVSYATGRCLAAGVQVDIEFPVGRPDLARIRGMRRGVFGPAVVFVALFPMLGLAFVVVAARRGRMQSRLLEQGRLGWATFVRREPTHVRVNNRPVWKLVYTLETSAGTRHEISARTHLPERATDDVREPVLYDADDPTEAVLWDLLPSAPRLDGSGEILPPDLVGTFFVLLPALATLAGHGWWIRRTTR